MITLVLSTLLLANGSPRGPELLSVDGDVSPVHDPAIIKQEHTWYLFSTGGSIRASTDLHHWGLVGKALQTLPDWVTAAVPGAHGGYWAPDISFYKGRYRLYYAVSTFGKNESAVGLAENTTLDPNSPDYKWVDRGMVIRSGRGDDFNAIDPNLAVDGKGGQWLTFGSFWGGIKLLRIDPETGKPANWDPHVYSLASRERRPDAIEAPFIVRHGRFFYLFVSFDYCCRGANSTYNVAVGRSTQITGPYRDMTGVLMTEGGGTRLTASTSLWKGPGHEGILMQRHGPDLMVFHAYDAATGKPTVKISTITWGGEWPHVAALPGS